MKRTIAALAAAVALAVLGAGSLLVYVRAVNARALAGQKIVQVLVATKQIPAGTSGADIRSGDYVHRIGLPVSTVPADALRSLDAGLDNEVVTAPLAPHQMLLRGQFGTAHQTSASALPLPKGTVAMTVPATVQGDVASYVEPGSRVAVFDTFAVVVDGQNTQVTKLLLTGVEVLAVGRRGSTGAQSENGAATANTAASKSAANDASPSVLVTLAVPQSDAVRVAQAAQAGLVYLALQDGSSTLTPGARVDNNSL